MQWTTSEREVAETVQVETALREQTSSKAQRGLNEQRGLNDRGIVDRIPWDENQRQRQGETTPRMKLGCR